MKYLYQALEDYEKSDIYPFHMPGHKRRHLPFFDAYGIDITEIEGFDNLHHAQGILKEAQNRAAELYGARHCYYLVNGSTCGILAAICAAVGKRQKILVARNSHKAVYHACMLAEQQVEYLYPTMTACKIQGQITPEQVEDALKAHSQIAAVVVTSPTYEGIISDIEKIAHTAHQYGVPLIVDAAHGAHLGFGGQFPENPVRLGADAVIVSLHKTLPSFTQTALLHLNSERISQKKVEKYLGIFETSSPSYVFMAGMDACIHLLKEQGNELFCDYRKHLDNFYQSCQDLQNLHVMTRADLSAAEAFDWDDSKIVVFTTDTGKSGEWLCEELLCRFHLQLEMASADYALAMTSIMDTQDGYQRLAEALHKIDRELASPDAGLQIDADKKCFLEEVYQPNPRQMHIYEAQEKNVCEVSFLEAVGKASADFIFLYPPGIPIIVPGEVFTKELIEKMQLCISLHLNLQGGTDLFAGRINIIV